MTADVRHLSNRLAIDGGTPIRSTPLPWELPGAYYIDEEEKRLVNQVIDARSPFRFYGLDAQGMVDRLESEWCSTFGHKHALGVNSGSAALHIALAAFGVGPGDEVLVPGYMWVSCMSAIVRTGAIPRLVDIDGSFCMDPVDLERKIGPRSKAVLIVNMSGVMGRNDRIAEICRKHKLRLLEDCAQAIGASLKGRSAGSYGDIGIYSFQLNKNMTSGEGGLLVTEDEDLYKRCVALHDLGYARNAEAGSIRRTNAISIGVSAAACPSFREPWRSPRCGRCGRLRPRCGKRNGRFARPSRIFPASACVRSTIRPEIPARS